MELPVIHQGLSALHRGNKRKRCALLDCLKQLGILNNTLVIYTSDNSLFLDEHSWCDKRFMDEPSIRTPLLVRYPRYFKAGHQKIGGWHSTTAMNYPQPHSILPHYGVRINRYKLVCYPKTNEWELFDPQVDLNESQNFYA